MNEEIRNNKIREEEPEENVKEICDDDLENVTGGMRPLVNSGQP